MGDQTSLDAIAYAEVLKNRTGYPFYTPQARGVIGDCGIIRDGRFIPLFNCFVDGIGGERLQTSEPNPGRIPRAADLRGYLSATDFTERSVQVESNEDVVWRAHVGNHWSVKLAIPIPLPAVEVGFGFQAARSSGKAAFLVPGGANRRVERFHKEKVFPRYLARHNDHIRDRFGSDVSTRTVYAIEGTTHASSWCLGVATQHESDVEGFVAVNPMAALPGFRVCGKTGKSILHPWTISPGPPFQPPDGSLHLISAKLAVKRTRRFNAFRSRSATKLAQDSSSQSPDDLGLWPTSRSYPSRGRDITSGDLFVGSTSGASHQSSTAAQINPESNEVVPDDISALSSSTDTSSDDDTLNPPNVIEILLDAVLTKYPLYGAIVVGWSVLEAFWMNLGKNTEYDVSKLSFDVVMVEEQGDGPVGQLHKIFSESLSEPEEDNTIDLVQQFEDRCNEPIQVEGYDGTGDSRMSNNNSNENYIEGDAHVFNNNENESEIWGGSDSGSIVNNNPNYNYVSGTPSPNGSVVRIENNNGNVNRIYGGGRVGGASGTFGGGESVSPARWPAHWPPFGGSSSSSIASNWPFGQISSPNRGDSQPGRNGDQNSAQSPNGWPGWTPPPSESGRRLGD